ncbi:hypothetical protein MPLDJ20_300001 [Mesorhizobium plurifarium]|uniref:Uncharacterized protein n=1 Tax=Mesorhizobium plurifarium TaxID=69974 RepID=A0A090FAG9_MESPL|nr:hypothetical protein MPLDJ20_300001 [Mesorhizobium plurifarium]
MLEALDHRSDRRANPTAPRIRQSTTNFWQSSLVIAAPHTRRGCIGANQEPDRAQPSKTPR